VNGLEHSSIIIFLLSSSVIGLNNRDGGVQYTNIGVLQLHLVHSNLNGSQLHQGIVRFQALLSKYMTGELAVG